MATPELRHMLRDDDLNHEEQKQVLELAIKFHNDRFYHQPFAGPQGIAVIFDKPSTRTRSSFSIGVAELGGYPLVIDKSGSQLAVANRLPTPHVCLTAWPMAWCGAPLARIVWRKWRSIPPIRW
mgnify:CR=1 FL=1